MSTMAQLPPEQRLGLIAWTALTALQPVWLVVAITTVPLLLPLLAIRDVRRALLWVGILSLFYFCHGVSEAWSAADQRWPAIIEIVLTVLLIGLLGAGVKRKAR
jgi:uncharacterized membrane protein